MVLSGRRHEKDTGPSVDRYFLISVIVFILQKSRLFHWLCEGEFTSRAHLCRQPQRLTRHFAKLSQYYNGVNDLIYHARRYFQRGIHCRWVESASEARLN